HGPVAILLAKEADESMRNLSGTTGFSHHFAEHRSQRYNNSDVSQRATYAYLKGMDDGLERHTCGYGQSKRGEKQRNEGIQLENGNENNKADDGDESRE